MTNTNTPVKIDSVGILHFQGTAISDKMSMLNMLKDNDGASEQEETLIPCFRCGICCTRYQARLSLTEARRINEELEISWEEFVEGYTDLNWPGTESFLIRHSTGACIFLKHEEGSSVAICLIHPFRPSSCRDWNPSQYRPECQEGLNNYWGLKISPAGKFQGAQHKIQRFQSFLESLG